MAAKEKKASLSKILMKDIQPEKFMDSTKLRRGVRKSAPSVLYDGKTYSEQKNSAALRKNKREVPPQDGRVTPGTRKRRNVTDVEEEHEAIKTPPSTGFKTKKTFLEKELEDILENATGRNTPLTPRNRKINEREDESEPEKLARTRKGGSSDPSSSSSSLDVIDEKSVINISKIKKDADDDNVSVRSFSNLRTRKAADKDPDDDSLSGRSVSLKSRKVEANNGDPAPVASLTRSSLLRKVGRKRKTAAVTKKNILLKRGRPKKGQSRSKGRKTTRKKSSRRKTQEDLIDRKESKRLINKSLKYQNATGSQRRLRSAMLQKQKVKTPDVTTDEKSKQASSKGILIAVKNGKAELIEVVKDTGDKERMKSDEQTVKNELSKSDGSEPVNEETEEPKKDSPIGACKKKTVKKDGMVKEDDKFVYGEKSNDSFFSTEEETAAKSNGDKTSQKIIKQPKIKRTKKYSSDSRKRKRVVPGLHFETTSSPDDSSVIIVQPRLGPKVKYARNKQLPVNKPASDIRPKEVVPNNVLPIANNSTVSNLNQIGRSYFVQPLPNIKLLTSNSIIRNYGSNAAASTNLDSTTTVSSSNLPFVKESDRSLTSLGPKIWPNDVIVTPSGIVLSNSRLISSGTNQQTPNICINGSNAAFVSDSPNSNILYSAQNSVGNVSSTKLFYQNSANIIQPQTCSNTTTAVLLQLPDSTSTSVVSSTTETVVANSDGGARLNGAINVGKFNGYSIEEASEEGENDYSENSQNLLQDPDYVPTIPVAKNVNELLILQGKASDSESTLDKTDENTLNNELDEEERTTEEGQNAKRARRTLRNVRQNHSSVSELTFSEPENSFCEEEDTSLYKTVSCGRLDKTPEEEETAKVLLQLGSEPVSISQSIAPFETASAFLLDQSGIYDNKLNIDLAEQRDLPCQTEGAADVCNFSEENAEALRELGLDSDPDQTRVEIDGEISLTRTVQNADSTLETMDHSQKEKMKEEVDNVLKEMPNRKVPNLIRKSECYSVNKRKMEPKTPLVLKNNDYLSTSPSKPPTVIDKLLEKNKSLKKAEQESRYKSRVRNHTENAQDYEKNEQGCRMTLRELRPRKPSKTEQRRPATNRRYPSRTSGCEEYERRDSNPEIDSGDYSDDDGDSNENVPLSVALEMWERRQRRKSHELDQAQKVSDRRNSLPVTSGKREDAKKGKTEKIKTILIRSSTPFTNKNHKEKQQTRVINIITGDDGSKKGQNLREEIGMEIEKDAREKAYARGESHRRRKSMESSETSGAESLKRLNGITVSKSQKSTESSYAGSKRTPRVEKIRLTLDRKRTEEKRSAAAQEEDWATKETMLNALGLRRAAVETAQKKDSSSNSSPSQSDSGNYTGTLKTVIKIQRQEKKGNSKCSTRTIYKASSSSSSISVQNEEQNSEQQEADTASREPQETEEDTRNDKEKSLVIPEKASSFSIHPGRLCSDVCAYCFGKFGLLDTPCHIAQLKDVHKRISILEAETHLLADSCLCDACYRHVDKKSNCPPSTERRTNRRNCQERKQICCAESCDAESQHNLKRKWFSKLKKYIDPIINLDPAKLERSQSNQLIFLCDRHFDSIDCHLKCAICNKKLGSILRAVARGDDQEDSDNESEASSQRSKRPRIDAEPTATATSDTQRSDNETELSTEEAEREAESEQASEVMEVSHVNIPPKANTNLDFGGVSLTPSNTEVSPTQIHVKLGNLNIGALGNLNIGQDVRHGTRPNEMQCFPTDAELALRAHFHSEPMAEDESARGDRRGFERCTTTLQFSRETKLLFQRLQMPYGNYSSFMRHLILLEKYFRSGDLVLAQNATAKATNYVNSVKNRLRSYEGTSVSANRQPAEAPASLTIQPRPPRPATANVQEIRPAVIQSRPFTLTPMPSSSSFPRSSPLSHMQATVQNLPGPSNQATIPANVYLASLLKFQSRNRAFELRQNQPGGNIPDHIFATSFDLTQDILQYYPIPPPPPGYAWLAHNPEYRRTCMVDWDLTKGVIYRHIVNGQDRSFVRLNVDGKIIHLSMFQYRRIAHAQMRRKLYMEHIARLRAAGIIDDDMLARAAASSVQVINQSQAGNETFPCITDVRSLAGQENTGWERIPAEISDPTNESFPRIPRALSVSVTTVPVRESPPEDRSREQAE